VKVGLIGAYFSINPSFGAKSPHDLSVIILHMPDRVKVAIETLGCKLNQAESETLARRFAAAGYATAAPDDIADVYILNTCTVTHIADRKSRQLLRAAKRQNPEALIIAAGCYAERDVRALESAGADLVVSNSDKAAIIELVDQRGGKKQSTVQIASSRTRTFVKVQDGCSRRCAYCIVPHVRGPGKSMPADDVISEIESRVSEGYKEVVITGTEVGSYSSDGIDISRLIARILEETGVERLRVSSLQPFEITEDLLKLWKSPRLCPHFHISLQSGSASVLKRMRRGYSPPAYEKAVKAIRKTLPDASITTDIIVGFPGESETEFDENLAYCRSIGFGRIHVFSFSPRPDTEAAMMPDQISSLLKKRRMRSMLSLARESAADFHRQFMGQTMEVLWEQAEDGIWSGYTPNYIRVYARSERELANRCISAKIGEPYQDGVWAELIDKEQK
jgi:threonylcarbamoyladenosine tRNA methylthiotransferase MtaB